MIRKTKNQFIKPSLKVFIKLSIRLKIGITQFKTRSPNRFNIFRLNFMRRYRMKFFFDCVPQLRGNVLDIHNMKKKEREATCLFNLFAAAMKLKGVCHGSALVLGFMACLHSPPSQIIYSASSPREFSFTSSSEIVDNSPSSSSSRKQIPNLPVLIF